MKLVPLLRYEGCHVYLFRFSWAPSRAGYTYNFLIWKNPIGKKKDFCRLLSITKPILSVLTPNTAELHLLPCWPPSSAELVQTTPCNCFLLDIFFLLDGPCAQDGTVSPGTQSTPCFRENEVVAHALLDHCCKNQFDDAYWSRKLESVITSSPTLKSGSQVQVYTFLSQSRNMLVRLIGDSSGVCVCVSSLSPTDRSRPYNNTSKKIVTLISVYDVTLTFHEQPNFYKPLNTALRNSHLLSCTSMDFLSRMPTLPVPKPV